MMEAEEDTWIKLGDAASQVVAALLQERETGYPQEVNFSGNGQTELPESWLNLSCSQPQGGVRGRYEALGLRGLPGNLV
jgi:hypothetical protein